MLKFPSIEQFRNIVTEIKRRKTFMGYNGTGEPVYLSTGIVFPTIKFRGTVKLHGTNAGIEYDVETGELAYQSRERVLTLEQDNAGFMLFMMNRADLWTRILSSLAGCYSFFGKAAKVVVYGEWCGQGIQKGVAITQLPKMFVVFGLRLVFDDGRERWAEIDETGFFDLPEDQIYNIYSFPTYEIEIDFNRPELAQNEMVRITEQVEAECPVGKHFGISGIGEGVVWWDGNDLRFKVKGEKHSVSKVKTLAQVDVEVIESMREFVESVVTEARLEQGLDNLLREQLKTFDMSSTGDFLRWVVNDIIKEETDTIVSNQFDPKKLNPMISKAARQWYIEKVNTAYD